MGKIMQTWAWTKNQQQTVSFRNILLERNCDQDAGKISYEQALQEKMIEVEQVENYDGISQGRVTNNSSWKIELFKGDEMIGKHMERLLTIIITLEQNSTVVVPAFFLSSAYFFDEGMFSIQQYLHHFKAMDQQAGVVYKNNGKIIGKRFGSFPLQVEVSYTHFPVHFAFPEDETH
ncbi:MAG: hypothetical protein KQH63_14375 [Desulfobulbaceae bacterium]|nr:hypothetical protein [Desulfobulbaceae bacterium]